MHEELNIDIQDSEDSTPQRREILRQCMLKDNH